MIILIVGFPGSTVVKNPPANARDTRDAGSTPGSRRYPGEGNGNPLHYSYLGNSMYRRAWWAAVHGVRKESCTTQWQKCNNSNCAFPSQIFSDLEKSMRLVGRECLLWPVCSLGRTLISLCPASVHTPRPNLPVAPGVSWLPPFHSSPL